MLIEEILSEKCWKGYEKKGMKTMFGKRVPNCVKKEAVQLGPDGNLVFEDDLDEDLKKWFKEKWVDISRPKKKGKYQPCGRGKAKTSRKGYPKCVPLARARTMSKAQKRSAVRRKRAVPQGVGGRPTNVRTFTKRRRRKKK